jgi:hypothetical protein
LANASFTIDAPRVQVVQLLLGDTRSISFQGGVLPSTIKRIVISTHHCSFLPSGAVSILQPSGLYCTHPEFFSHLPHLEEAVIAVHGLPPWSSVRPAVQWPVLKKLLVVFEVGVADFISHIDMPMADAVSIIYPEWLLSRLNSSSSLTSYLSVMDGSDSSDEEGHGLYDSDDDYHAGSDGSNGGYLPERHIPDSRPSLASCYFDEERKKLTVKFLHVDILTYHHYSCPDRYYFDTIPAHFSPFVDY